MAGETLQEMVGRQVDRVLARGQRWGSFDQIRQRHFWASYLFAYGAGNTIPAGSYEIFKVIPSQTGQGYPAGVPLSLRETNWKNAGRVPDNQNFVIQELGVTMLRPQAVDGDGPLGVPANAPANGIWSNIPAATQALIAPRRPIHPQDAYNVLYGGVLEMQYLTNQVPLGLCAYFSQSGGIYSQEEQISALSVIDQPDGPFIGDPCNGTPAAAFRRKLEIPILLQHGEAMGMVLRFPEPVQTLTLDEGGAGWAELRVDWWATESFVEMS